MALSRTPSVLGLAIAFLAVPAAGSTTTAYDGPPRAFVDTPLASVATLFATVPGPVERVTVFVETSARYADNLEVQLFHDDVAVILYDGNGGDTVDAQIEATFADEAGQGYPTPGAVQGSFAPSPGSLSSFVGREAGGAWELRIRNKYGFAGDGTELRAWRLTLETGLAGPPVAVAVYDDGAYVDTVDDGPTEAEAEATNVKASLASLGHHVFGFEGTSAAAWSAGVAGRQVLVVPELEEGDLAAALDESAEGVIGAFVAGGGTLVKLGAQPRDLDLLNEVFGTTLDPGGAQEPFGLRSDAIGTRFQQGPGSLPYNYVTIGVLGLPLDARSIHQDGAGGYPVVASIPFGSGTVVSLGWDWYDAAPRGTQDGGWLEILDRAVQGEARALSTRTVALYYDGDFVDLTEDGIPGDDDAEGLNLEAALASLGHLPAPFFGTDLLSFQEAFETAPVLEIPELEVGDLAAALPSEVVLALREYVASGGVLIVHGDTNGYFALLLNGVFGFATTRGESLTYGQLALEPFLEATRFAGAVTNLYGNDTTYALVDPPPGALHVYEPPGEDPGVVRIPYGSGKIVYLGWDWYDGAPRGSQDEGWRFVLDRAVLEAPLPVPEPGGAALALAAGVALARLRRRVRS